MSTAQPIDVRDMAIVHRTFRKVFDRIRAAGARRAGAVAGAGHVPGRSHRFRHRGPAHPSRGEDELLYPKLIERVPEQAPMTEQVDREHQTIRTALDAASAACATWRQRPSAQTGESLAAAL